MAHMSLFYIQLICTSVSKYMNLAHVNILYVKHFLCDLSTGPLPDEQCYVMYACVKPYWDIHTTCTMT